MRTAPGAPESAAGGAAAAPSFATELGAALRRRPRSIEPKWFYDAAGSALFERICELPEYYPTRTELALLDRHAAAIAGRIGAGADLVEFGAGATRKVRVLLQALQRPARYVAVDISGDHLAESTARLRADHPRLDVVAVAADFTGPAAALPTARGRRVGFFPGSSIGNFDPGAAAALLRRFAGWLDGGGLLIGVDLVKRPDILHAAYNDAAGVTAAFNKNLWVRANAEAGADFDLDAWDHAAFYNAPQQRIEMHLVSRCQQAVTVGGERHRFDEGEAVHTENSYKYTVEGFQALAGAAGWQPREAWVDPSRLFSLHWLEAGPRTGAHR